MTTEVEVAQQIEHDARIREAGRTGWRERVQTIQSTTREQRRQELRNRLSILEARQANVLRKLTPAAMLHRLRAEVEAKGEAYRQEIDAIAQAGALTVADLDLCSEGAQCFFHGKEIMVAVTRCTGTEATTGEQLSREASLRSIAEEIHTITEELEELEPDLPKPAVAR